MKLRKVSEIRYYLYVSTAKLDMLYEQMYETSKSSSKKALSAKVPFGSATFESSTEEVVGRDEKLRTEGLLQRHYENALGLV
jgi:hypothetical protein